MTTSLLPPNHDRPDTQAHDRNTDHRDHPIPARSELELGLLLANLIASACYGPRGEHR